MHHAAQPPIPPMPPMRPIPPMPPMPLTGAGWRARPRRLVHGATIRGQIFAAFLAMSVITAALGGYAAVELRHAGALVERTFDKSLMSVSYARAAAADFAAMQAAFARRWTAGQPAIQRDLDARIDDLATALAEDLTIAAERSQSPRAERAARDAGRAVRDWEAARGALTAAPGPAAWAALDHQAAIADQDIDLAINYTAGDGFADRQRAREIVAFDRAFNLGATMAALLLSAVVVWLLARRITRPVAAASAAAGRIARGDLDTPIPAGGSDELGELLAAMAVMRDNIRAMMERETGQRRSAQARLADALHSSREGFVVVDAEGRIAQINARAADFLGGPAGAWQPGTPFAAVAPAIAGAAQRAALVSGDDAEAEAGDVRLPDGRWLRVSRGDTADGGYITVCTDITALRDKTTLLEASKRWLDAALGNIAQGLCLYDADGRLRVVNRRFADIFGLDPTRVTPGRTLREVLALTVPAAAPGDPALDTLLLEEAPPRAAIPPPGTARLRHLPDGRTVAVTRQVMDDGGWVATYEDVTERRRAEQQILFMARHDALTGLPNRTLFAERVDRAIALAAPRPGGGDAVGGAILLLDLDRFKAVNDTLGHPAGDALLSAVAQRLRACVRDADMVARLGGDEFAIVQDGPAAYEGASALARRIVHAVGEPYDIDGNRVVIGTSVGIALAPADGDSCGTLLKHADLALYKAKAEGRGTWRFFEAEMDARIQERRLLELDLRAALAANAFELYYQPFYDLRENRVAGLEALARWHHPTRGMIPPARFIPVAEEIGVIVELGDWVLRRACAEARTWPDHVKVAVNVSPAQFSAGDLAHRVRDALSQSGLPAHRLELEITESVLLADSAANLAILHAIRATGVEISMDDFGTGYASLGYLRSFPFDKIKIDQSFIRDLTREDDPDEMARGREPGGKQGTRAIVRAITELGVTLGIRTTAEGVETIEQLTWLRDGGCDEVQGYYLSRPTPAAEIPALLAGWDTALATPGLATPHLAPGPADPGGLDAHVP